MHKILFIFTLLLGFTFSVTAQKRCGTTAYEKYLKSKNHTIESQAHFEGWLHNRSSMKETASLRRATLVTIPVVIHVVHNGEPQGSGSNISDAQILSQIDVINEDLRRLNTDAAETLDEFAPVAADIEVELVLAKRDPEGLATNGILRLQGTKSTWKMSDLAELTSLSYWAAEEYLNIWITPLSNDFLGFAQFPVSDLEGLEEATNNRLVDGMVIRPESFGRNNTNFPILKAPYHLGRTVTHELGHFLGLRHIWGDGGCDEDDFCNDTPASNASHVGCKLTSTSCGSLDMVQNYMDFTDDVCMNLFTEDQKNRMRTVLDNSPRRKSLTTSLGGISPIAVADDLGIKEILSPTKGLCDSNFTPQIEVRNYGTNQINSAVIKLFLDDMLIETKNVILNLNLLSISNISFSNIIVTSGSHSLHFEIAQTNGTTDNNIENNNGTVTFNYSEKIITGFTEAFNIFPNQWNIINKESNNTWALKNAPNTNTNNSAIAMDYFNYDGLIGETGKLLSPIIDFSNFETARLTYKIAYAMRAEKQDRLTIAISTDCGNTFEHSNVIFDKAGNELATAPSTNEAFIPKGKYDWVFKTVDLSRFIGEENVQIAFTAQNGKGNIIYLDDLNLIVENQVNTDISITRIDNPPFVLCEKNTTPSITVKNLGTNTINTFTAEIKLASNSLQTINYTGSPINSNDEVVITFDEIILSEGENELTFSLSNPNNIGDENSDNNSKTLNTKVTAGKELIPIREKFKTQNLNETGWAVANDDGDITWQITNAGGNGNSNFSAFINGFDYGNIGATDWLISPPLDFSQTDKASMTFKVSYGSNRNYEDALRVYISEDCGENFSDLVFIKIGELLGVSNTTNAWQPTISTDWRTEYVNLNQFTGLDNVRVAFAFENAFGNNLYLDDIEFFQTADVDLFRPQENTFILFPNPTDSEFKLTFNLAEKEDVQISIYDVRGALIYQGMFKKTLNHTYEFDIPSLRNGIYLIKAVGESMNQVKRIFVNK